jgi:hypothetical protein
MEINIVTHKGLAWRIITGSGFDDYNQLLQLTIILQPNPSSLKVEASLQSVTHSTTDGKWPSLSPIKFRHGPRTENTLRTLYPSNSSIFIETAILLLLPTLPRKCVYRTLLSNESCQLAFTETCFNKPLSSNGLFRQNIYLIIKMVTYLKQFIYFKRASCTTSPMMIIHTSARKLK